MVCHAVKKPTAIASNRPYPNFAKNSDSGLSNLLSTCCKNLSHELKLGIMCVLLSVEFECEITAKVFKMEKNIEKRILKN